MSKLMELAMGAGLTFTWDARFGYLKFDHYDVHILEGGVYEVRWKNNEVATIKRGAWAVVDWICGGLT